MIKKNLLILFTILSALALGACGSSSGGGGGDGGFPTGGFTKSFGVIISGGDSLPFHDTYDVKIQYLYTASEINGSGNITTLRFNRPSETTSEKTCQNMTVKLGHTSLPQLTNTFASNVQQGKGTQVTVLNNTTVTIPVGAAGTWFDVALTTPFYYNGTDNLVVELERTTACSASQLATTTLAATNRRAASLASDVTAGVADHNQTTSNPPSKPQIWMQFVFAGGDNAQRYSAGVSSSWPFNSVTTTKNQSLYTATNIKGSGPITAIGFQLDSASVPGTYTYNVKMGHTTLTALTTGSNFADGYNVNGVTTVANAQTFTIPDGISAGEWFWVPIPDGIFNYNGTNNLLVEVEIPSATATNFVKITDMGGSNIRMWNTDATATASIDSDPSAYHMKFRFNGGTMDKITGTSNPEGVVFSGANSGKVQYIFRPSELGTSGTITGVACRLFNPNVADTNFTNTEVVLAHRVTDSLSTTFSDNITGGTVVRTGTYTMAAGLLTGDWADIPFTTPFAYNGTDNLVVQIATDASAMRRCYIQNAATLYLGRRMSNADRTSATGTVSDYLLNSRFMISK